MAISQPAARCIANCIPFLHSHPISQPTIALTITLTLSLNQLPLLIRPISTLYFSLYLFSLSLPNAMGNVHPPLSLPTPHNKFILNYFSNFPDPDHPVSRLTTSHNKSEPPLLQPPCHVQIRVLHIDRSIGNLICF